MLEFPIRLCKSRETLPLDGTLLYSMKQIQVRGPALDGCNGRTRSWALHSDLIPLPFRIRTDLPSRFVRQGCPTEWLSNLVTTCKLRLLSHSEALWWSEGRYIYFLVKKSFATRRIRRVFIINSCLKHDDVLADRQIGGIALPLLHFFINRSNGSNVRRIWIYFRIVCHVNNWQATD